MESLKTPRTEAEFKKLFGEFSYTELKGGSILPDKSFRKRICKVEFGPSGLGAHWVLKPMLERMWQEWLASDSQYKVLRAECYCPRHQYWNPKKPLSIHSWGCAIDINPAENMPGTRGDLSPTLVALFEKNGWVWGGRWKYRDPMHFQFYAGPSF